MCTLIIETSTAEGSLALVEDGQPVVERSFAGGRSHNALIFAPLQEVLEPVRNIRQVLVGSGPGSYSGTRVGIATAQGVAIAHQCPAIALPSVLALPSARAAAGCMVVGDARRGSYWRVELARGEWLGPLILSAAAEFCAAVREAHDRGLVLVCLEALGTNPLPNGLTVRRETPTAAGLWAAWQRASDEQRRVWRTQAPQPQYLKPPHITPAKTRPLTS